jgi:hypothetical protein
MLPTFHAFGEQLKLLTEVRPLLLHLLFVVLVNQFQRDVARSLTIVLGTSDRHI